MDLYFLNTVGADPTALGNWFEDAGGTISASGLPSGSDAVFIQSGVCDTSDFTRSTLTVEAAGSLTINPTGKEVADNNGTIVENQGSITVNDGTVTLNGSYGSVTTNNGVVASNLSVVVDNYGQVNGNAGQVVTNHAGGTVTPPACGSIVTNNGIAYIPAIGGGSGELASASSSDLSGHASSGSVTLPSGSPNWW